MSLFTAFDDRPINQPTEDLFSFDAFARAIASSIGLLTHPEGTVIAITGPWGSGKSSALNLVRFHLKTEIEAKTLAPISFNCWWFRGSEALALAFFRELSAGIGPTVGKRFRKSLKKLGSRLLRAGSAVGAGIDLAGGGGTGGVVSGAMNWVASLVNEEETVESLHHDLSKLLSEQKKRFLIIIDDIDRLSPDEALLVFRLVKSIGRLPNVIYLLAFDRILAEAVVSAQYPAEGPHYLEKIIQASFELPTPDQAILREQFLLQLGALCGQLPDGELVRFMNIFYDVVAPVLKTPRDMVRLLAAIFVTWPPVGNEVNLADFVAIETLRFSRPKLYQAIRQNQNVLCGISDDSFHVDTNARKQRVERLLLSSIPVDEVEHYQKVLMHLFPRLSAVWSNTHYGSDWLSTWRQQRLVCAKEHFDTYFRYTIGDAAIPKTEIDELVANAGDPEFVKAVFRASLQTKRHNGATRASLLLEELNVSANQVAEANVNPLLRAIFSIADELNVPTDRAGAFEIGDNQLRIHWLLRRLTLERFSLEARSDIFLSALTDAQPVWFCNFAESAHSDYYPCDGRQPTEEARCLVTKVVAEDLRRREHDVITSAASSGSLAASDSLLYLLWRWKDVIGDDGAEVRRWTDEQLDRDEMIVRFSRALTSYSWSQTFGDAVAIRQMQASVDGLDKIMDKDRFRARVEAVCMTGTLAPEEQKTVSEFLDAWKKRDKNPNGF